MIGGAFVLGGVVRYLLVGDGKPSKTARRPTFTGTLERHGAALGISGHF